MSVRDYERTNTSGLCRERFIMSARRMPAHRSSDKSDRRWLSVAVTRPGVEAAHCAPYAIRCYRPRPTFHAARSYFPLDAST